MTAKIATIFVFPKIILPSLIKIAGCRLKIAIRHLKISVRYLKISGLKISVDSLKIAGLKIIARVCVYVCAWVRSHFAEVSKMAQDATRSGTQRPGRPPRAGAKEHKHQSDHHNRNTSDQSRSDHRKSRSTSGTQRTRIAKRNYKNNSK